MIGIFITPADETLPDTIEAMNIATREWTAKAARGECAWICYAVANKFPGESRHQTALRYIRNAEKGSDNATMQEDKP